MPRGTVPERIGAFGLLLATWGTLGFVAFAPASIAIFEICWGIAFLGLLLALATRRLAYRPTPVDVPLAIYVGVEILAIIFAADRKASLRAAGGDWILIFLPVFAQTLRGSRDVRRAFNVLLAASSLVASYAIWQVFGGQDLLRHRALEPIGSWYIATGLFGHHLTYGGSVLITAALSMSLLFDRTGTRRARSIRGLETLLQVGGVVASFARTAWTGMLAGAVGLAVASRGLARRVVLIALVVISAAAVAFPPIRLRLSALAGFREDPRVRLWETALRIWKAHPILGTGPGSFPWQFPAYKVPGEYFSTVHPHNDPLNILVQYGILGLGAFVYIWVRYFRFLGRALRRLPATDPRRPLLIAGNVVVVAFFVGSLGQCFITDETVGSLFWFFVAASLVVAREVCDGSA